MSASKTIRHVDMYEDTYTGEGEGIWDGSNKNKSLFRTCFHPKSQSSTPLILNHPPPLFLIPPLSISMMYSQHWIEGTNWPLACPISMITMRIRLLRSIVESGNRAWNVGNRVFIFLIISWETWGDEFLHFKLYLSGHIFLGYPTYNCCHIFLTMINDVQPPTHSRCFLTLQSQVDN